MARRRKLGTQKISFFAFQDIITAITGILILVTLILTLFLNNPSAFSSGDGSLEDPLMTELNETLEELKRVNSENQSRQMLLTDAATAPNASRLDQDIDSIKTQVNNVRRELDLTKQKLVQKQYEAHSLAAQLGLTKNDEEKESLSELEKENKNTQTTMLDMKKRMEAIVRNKNQLWLIPDNAPQSKENLLVVVSKDGVTLEQFAAPETRREFEGATAPGQFVSAMRQWNPRGLHLVFYVRPSGIRLFNFCKTKAQEAGFTVGYDALEEEKQIFFGGPSAEPTSKL